MNDETKTKKICNYKIILQWLRFYPIDFREDLNILFADTKMKHLIYCL